MKSLFLMLAVLAQTLEAQPNVVQRVTEDAIVLDRVAEASKRDLPRDLLGRIVAEDIDLLRGKRADGTYEYATFDRFDSGRIAESFSIQPRGEERTETVEVKGDWVYRVLIEVPSRKMLVRKNEPIWIDRVDVEYLGERSTANQRESIEIRQWLKPGEFRPVDLPEVARRATVRVMASAAEKGGYGNVNVALVKARIVDNADSPYADAVASAKAVQRALENGDLPSIRAMARRMRTSLGGTPATATIDVPARRTEMDRPAPALQPAAPAVDLNELQTIEDLLTGSEQERRQGMDRLHQLIRRLRQ